MVLKTCRIELNLVVSNLPSITLSLVHLIDCPNPTWEMPRHLSFRVVHLPISTLPEHRRFQIGRAPCRESDEFLARPGSAYKTHDVDDTTDAVARVRHMW